MRKNKLKLMQRNTFSLLCVVASVVSVVIFFKEFSLFFCEMFAAGLKIRKPVKSYITSCFYCEFISDLFSFGGGGHWEKPGSRYVHYTETEEVTRLCFYDLNDLADELFYW